MEWPSHLLRQYLLFCCFLRISALPLYLFWLFLTHHQLLLTAPQWFLLLSQSFLLQPELLLLLVLLSGHPLLNLPSAPHLRRKNPGFRHNYPDFRHFLFRNRYNFRHNSPKNLHSTHQIPLNLIPFHLQPLSQCCKLRQILHPIRKFLTTQKNRMVWIRHHTTAPFQTARWMNLPRKVFHTHCPEVKYQKAALAVLRSRYPGSDCSTAQMCSQHKPVKLKPVLP